MLINQRSFIKKTMTSFSRNRDDRVIQKERRFFLQKIISECKYFNIIILKQKYLKAYTTNRGWMISISDSKINDNISSQLLSQRGLNLPNVFSYSIILSM